MADAAAMQAHPEVFTVIPSQPTEKKSGQLPPEKVKEYFEEGFVIVEDFFEESELEACKNDFIDLVDDLAKRLYKAGKIKCLYDEFGLFERLIHMEKDFPGVVILYMKEGKLTQGVKDLWANDRLLNAVEQLIGPDILGHPVWHPRPKVPHNEFTTIPWNQTSAYFDKDLRYVHQVTAWIPFLDTNKENGCLEMLRRGHRTGAVCNHTCGWGDTWYVKMDEDDMKGKLGVTVEEDTVQAPVPYRGLVLFNNMTPHRSPQNASNKIRWTVDLRYQTPHQPIGFHGLMKEGILMRSSKDPSLKIDWERFECERKSDEKCEGAKEDDFSTIVTGPWMKVWPIVNENRHTKQVPTENRPGWNICGLPKEI